MSQVFSMTGFASIQGTLPSGRVFGMAIKSVNHRHLDLLIRVPSGMDALEAAMRNAIKAAVHRGHVELTLSLEKNSSASTVELDESLLEAYVRASERAATRFSQAHTLDINALLRMPGVMAATMPTLDPKEAEAPALAALDQLLIALDRKSVV